MGADGHGGHDRGILLDGQWLPTGEVHSVRNPANGSEVAAVALARPQDVDAAVRIAAAAQPEWAATHPDRRAEILHRAAGLVRERVDAIALALTLEQGKPIPDSRKEILFGATVLDYYAEEGRRVGGSVRPNASAATSSVITYAPMGVVAAIVPWNYPVDLYCWKIAPALAAGCAVVGKPPVEAPVAIGMVAGILLEAGVPSGVLADLPGGADVGQAMVAHPGVAMVTATCSTAAGKAIMRSAADGLKKVSLELGGHAPLVVLDDADIPLAAAAAARRSFSNMGQICIAVNRIIVADAVADAFVAELAGLTEAIELGDPSADGVLYGPCTTAAVVERARDHVADALERGATLVTGGAAPEGAEFTSGHYYRPTVLDHVPAAARVLHEETFGPVLAVHRVADVAEAIASANATDYGLAAYIYGEDLARAWAVAERIDSGGVGINVNDVSELQSPFGGWKQSGLGTELGPEGLYAYLKPKHTKLRRPTLTPNLG